MQANAHFLVVNALFCKANESQHFASETKNNESFSIDMFHFTLCLRRPLLVPNKNMIYDYIWCIYEYIMYSYTVYQRYKPTTERIWIRSTIAPRFQATTTTPYMVPTAVSESIGSNQPRPSHRHGNGPLSLAAGDWRCTYATQVCAGDLCRSKSWNETTPSHPQRPSVPFRSGSRRRRRFPARVGGCCWQAC